MHDLLRRHDDNVTRGRVSVRRQHSDVLSVTDRVTVKEKPAFSHNLEKTMAATWIISIVAGLIQWQHDFVYAFR